MIVAERTDFNRSGAQAKNIFRNKKEKIAELNLVAVAGIQVFQFIFQVVAKMAEKIIGMVCDELMQFTESVACIQFQYRNGARAGQGFKFARRIFIIVIVQKTAIAEPGYPAQQLHTCLIKIRDWKRYESSNQLYFLAYKACIRNRLPHHQSLNH